MDEFEIPEVDEEQYDTTPEEKDEEEETCDGCSI